MKEFRVRKFAALLVGIALWLSFSPLSLAANGAEASLGVHTQTNAVSYQLLDHELRVRADRVPEFKFIREQANRMGVRAFLFGGTASGFAHYVRWDLLREAGDSRFQPDRFDYDFTNIYRSNQDLDIVLDGTKEQIEEMQTILHATFPHFQGAKEAWEVRSLRENLGGTKIALLNSDDFLNQNTDSNSTGLVELTETEAHTSHDLFNWNQYPSQYLLDVAEGKIKYYRNPLHPKTDRYLQGKNPEIMSVVRYFIKAVQYELEMRPEDLTVIQQIINDFNPGENKDSYVTKKLEEIGKKLVQNAVNIEYAMKLIEQMGLRAKLISFSDPKTPDTMGWWLSRSPLQSYSVGRGSGKTAEELGISIVAHETRSFQAYESITRAHTGDPNVLISRQNVDGETAVFGDGFYTRAGKEGAVGTGLTIRFNVDPRARVGTDFTLAVDNQFVIFQNKSALRVIPESLRMGPVEFVRYLMSEELAPADRGIYEKLKRRAGNQMQNLSVAEREEIKSLFLHSFKAANVSFTVEFLLEHLSQLDIRGDELADVEILGKMLEPLPTTHPAVLKFVNFFKEWKSDPAIIKKLGTQLENMPKWGDRDFGMLDYVLIASGMAESISQSYLGGPYTDLTWMKALAIGQTRKAWRSNLVSHVITDALDHSKIGSDPAAAEWFKLYLAGVKLHPAIDHVVLLWANSRQALAQHEIATKIIEKASGTLPVTSRSTPYWTWFFEVYMDYLEAHAGLVPALSTEREMIITTESRKLPLRLVLRFLNSYERSSASSFEIERDLNRQIQWWFKGFKPLDANERQEYLQWLRSHNRSKLARALRMNIPADDREAHRILAEGLIAPRMQLSEIAKQAFDREAFDHTKSIENIAEFKFGQSVPILKRVLLETLRKSRGTVFQKYTRTIYVALNSLREVGSKDDLKTLRKVRGIFEQELGKNTKDRQDQRFINQAIALLDEVVGALESRPNNLPSLPRRAPRCEALFAR